MIDGKRVMELLAQHRTDEIMVTTMSSARAWPTYSKRPELDLPLLGSMGKASSLGLGIAMAQPDRRVVVLDGDGSLLMNLGALVTVAGIAPENLVHFVLEGYTYDTSGGQPTPGDKRADLAGLARASGYRTSVRIDDEATLAAKLPELLSAEGPTFVCVEVNSMWAPRHVQGVSTKTAWTRVREALASS